MIGEINQNEKIPMQNIKLYPLKNWGKGTILQYCAIWLTELHPKAHCFSITWSSTYILHYTEELKVVSIITLCSTNLSFCSQINSNLSESDTITLTMSSDCDSEDISHPSTSSTEYQNTDNLDKLSDLAPFNAACKRIKEKLRRFRRKAHRHSFS